MNIQQKQFSKVLNNSGILKDNYSLVTPNQIKEVLSYFQEGDQSKLEYNDICNTFFQYFRKKKLSWMSKARFLLILHQAIKVGQSQFVNAFLEQDHEQLKSLQAESNRKESKDLTTINLNQELWINNNIIIFYFNYLLRIANNYDIYQICLSQNELPSSEDPLLDYKLKIISLYKILNLYNFIIKIQKDVRIAFNDFQLEKQELLYEIAKSIAFDLKRFYNILVVEINKFQEFYMNLKIIDFLQYKQLYNDLQLVTSQLQELFEVLISHDKKKEIKPPQWCQIEPHFQKDINDYEQKIQILYAEGLHIKKIWPTNYVLQNQQQ